MKPINLLFLSNVFNTVPSFLSDFSLRTYLCLEAVKSRELEVINALCHELKLKVTQYSIYDNFYLNFTIPQIGKEFDLLRFGKSSVVNIELKSEMTDLDSIKEQLRRNYYYLSFLGKKIYCCTFVMDGTSNRLFYFNKNEYKLDEVKIDDLIYAISYIEDLEEGIIEQLFVPSNYLISPFNTTERFIENQYFLTKHQEQIKSNVSNHVLKGEASKIISISGTAGTGKTLLTYDLAKSFIHSGKNTTIVHCAQSNNGIDSLSFKHGWDIYSISGLGRISKNSDILILDESQRLTQTQLEKILKLTDGYKIFSHDVNQRLNRNNESKEVVEKIESLSGKLNYKLSNKIRYNKSLSSFIQKFFNLKKTKSDDLSGKDYKDISFYYTTCLVDAQKYISYLRSLNWEHIYLSNSLHTNEALDKVVFRSRNSSHKAIGQEYDDVVVTITEDFFYNSNSKLSYNVSSYYNPIETLFQAVTRTRKRLAIVIINNEDVYKKCMEIIHPLPKT